MKKLENTFEKDSNKFSLVARDEKAAMYLRKTLEDTLVCYEVFSIKSKNNEEIYPEAHAFGKWAWAPKSMDRAQTYFDRISKGEIVIPDVDPTTSEMIPLENDMSLEEMMAESEVENVSQPVENVVVESVVTTIPVETTVEPTIEIPIVVNSPVETVETPVETTDKVEVTPTNDGGVLVTVAKVKKDKVTYLYPTGEFLRNDFAKMNGMDHTPPHSDSYGPLMAEIKAGRVVELRKEKMGKGKPRSIYSAVVKTDSVLTPV